MTGMERNSDHRDHGQLRAAVRQSEPPRVESRPDQFRQLALVWPAQLLRPANVQPKIAAMCTLPDHGGIADGRNRTPAGGRSASALGTPRRNSRTSRSPRRTGRFCSRPISVTASDGWKLLGDGAQWRVQDGALRQTAEKEFIRALAGDQIVDRLHAHAQGPQTGRREGFLILFHIANDEDETWWNIGGWGNTQDAIENGETH